MTRHKPGRSEARPAEAPPAEPRRPWVLLIFVLTSGAVLMSLEIAGSRVLAPYFGSSAFVWGSLIGLFLGALAVGYKVGGLLADRWPSRPLLAAVGAAAGALVLLVPLLAEPVCTWADRVGLGPRYAPLASATGLFLWPSLLLGMVSPFAIKLTSRSITTIGNIAGTLYSLSTIGSIVGTLGTAFYLIPLLGLRGILLAIGLVQIAASALLLAASQARRLPTALAGLLAAGLLAEAIRLAEPPTVGLVYATDSAYHNILVVDEVQDDGSTWRRLKFDDWTESTIQLRPPDYPPPPGFYTDLFHLAPIFHPAIRRVLVVGGGGGIGPRQFLGYGPDVHVDLVEIDPAVLEVCRRYFFLGDDPRLRTHVRDGRLFVRSVAPGYDLVVLDAFTIGGRIPFHLTTREFLEEVRRILSPQGLVLSNLITAIDGPKSMLLKSELLTYEAVFPQVYVFPKDYRPGLGLEGHSYNVMLIGTQVPSRLAPAEILARAQRLVAEEAVPVPDLADRARPFDLRAAGIDLTGAVVLTDDHCPSDLYENR